MIIETLLGPLMNRRLSTITKGHLRRLHANITEKGSKTMPKGEKPIGGPEIANKSLMLMRAIFNRAIDHEMHSGPNPALGIEFNKRHSWDRRLMPD